MLSIIFLLCLVETDHLGANDQNIITDAPNIKSENVKLLRGFEYFKNLKDKIKKAKKYVYISTYILGSPKRSYVKEIYSLLERKSKKGVNVKLMANGKVSTNIKRKKEINTKYNFDVKLISKKKYLHTKIALIGNSGVFNSSANLTFSTFVNGLGETTFYIKDRKVKEICSKYFLQIWNKG